MQNLEFLNSLKVSIIYTLYFSYNQNVLETEEDKQNRLELVSMFATEPSEEEAEKNTNQFSFIERATQTKNNTTDCTESQTDALPM